MKDSKNSAGSGTDFLIGGGIVCVGGLVVLATDSNVINNSTSVDGQEIIGGVLTVAGLVGVYAGLFQLSDCESEKFNAVQRYNEVVFQETETSWNRPRSGRVHADLLTLKF
jgi:hypothetical protein